MKPNPILRVKIKLSNCKDYDEIKLSKFDLQWIEFVFISNSNPYCIKSPSLNVYYLNFT